MDGANVASLAYLFSEAGQGIPGVNVFPQQAQLFDLGDSFGSTVDVNITVSNTGTLGTLDRDRHLLTAALASAGVSGDAMTLRSGSTDVASGPSMSTHAGEQNGSDQPQGGFAGTSDNPSGAGGRRRDGAPAARGSSDPQTASGGATEQSRSAGLYV